jgi:hypothetical protein
MNIFKQATLFIVVAVFFLATSCKKNDNGDKNNPFIVLIGTNPMYWSQGSSPYEDPGATAWDITESNDTIDITNRLVVTENIDVNTSGEYNVKFNVTDEAGNKADEKTRLVKVILTK